MRLVWTFLLSAAVAAAQQNGRVEGRVLSSTGAPIGKATVRLAGSASAGGPAASYVEVSSSDGRFAVENIAPGRYTATAQRPGFAPVRTAAGAIAPVRFELTSGETKTGVEIRMVPLAVVSGIVTDADGDPVPNSQVALARYTFNQGRLILSRSGPNARSDDRGIFRLLNVQPGRYYVTASAGAVAIRPNEIRGRSALETNLPTYYPNARNPSGAVAIDVGSAELSNLNIRMLRGGTYSIQGNLVDSSGAAVRGQITVFARGGDNQPEGVNTQVRPQGDFQISGLAAGDYTIVARSTPARSAKGPATAALSGRIDVNVGGADLDNVTIRLSQGAEITGRLTLDSGEDLAAFMGSMPAANAPRAVAVEAAPAGGGVTTGPRVRMPSISIFSLEGPSAGMNATAAADGTFRISNVPPLKRILRVASLPANAYIKSVRFGGQDVTRSALDLSSGAGGILEIVIGTKGATITATPRDANGEAPQAGVPVTIWPRVPNPGSPTGDVSFLTGVASSQAQGLAPGEYYVAAWETNADYLRAPEFLARFTSLATRVTVAEGETVPVEPKIIPAEAIEKEMAQFP